MSDFHEPDAPTPQQLMAFADGELDATCRAQVAAWLDRHPEVAVELETANGLERIWATEPLPVPTASEWAAVQERIRAALPQPVRPLSGSRRGRWAVGASAAAVLATLVLYRPTAPEVALTKVSPQPVLVNPFAVVSDNDVEILSMDAGDADALVVGEVPMHGPVVLAGPGDVILDSLVPDEGMETPMQMGMGNSPDNGDGPMIVVRVAQADR